MSKEYLDKRDTDYIRNNLIFNYCLGNEEQNVIASFIHNNDIHIAFHPDHFYFLMTGINHQFVRSVSAEQFHTGVEMTLDTFDAMITSLEESGYTGQAFQIKTDNSKQIAVIFSPTEKVVDSLVDATQKMMACLHEKYTPMILPELELGACISTSFTGPYSGYEQLHQAFLDARELNNLRFFGIRDVVITKEYRDSTARPCDITAILANVRRLTSTLCTGTKKEALHQIDYLIDEMVAPSYLQLNFAALWAAFEDVLSMFETVYPERVTVEHGKLESFFTLKQYKQWAHRVVEALYAQLEGLRRYSPTLLMVLSFINRNYTTDLSLTQLAEYAYTNASVLSSEFNDEVGMSLSEYVTGLRVLKAQELLRQTNMTVSEIAEASGFSSAKYFREIFKKQAGMSPQQYRDNP